MADLEAAARLRAAAEQRPVFVVGCPRSGTTLLRMLLDSHPHVAVPPESHFVLGLAPRLRPFRLERQVARLRSHRWYRRWRLDDDDLLRALEVLRPADHPGLVRATFAAYAVAHGAERWADKTPGYVEHVGRLARLFPDLRVVHVIRDGREVAASLAEREWGPRSVVSGAFWWRRKVTAGRRWGRRLGPGRYREVRYEALVGDTEVTIRALCDWLDLPFHRAMLEYPRRAPERMRMHDPSAHRGAIQNLVLPPTPGLRDWRRGLSPGDQEAVEAVCGPLLRELGYAAAPAPRGALARAWGRRAADWAHTAHRDVAARLRPAARDY